MAGLGDILIRFTGRDDGASAAAKKTADALDRVARSMQKANQSTTQARVGAVGIANTYKGLVGQVASLNKGINIFGATIRQIGQGLQNLGTTTTAFLSAPAALISSASIRTILTFDDLLIDVRKNAGLTTDQMYNLREGIMSLAQATPTSLEDLTRIADSAGRLGLGLTATPVENILGFIKVIDQLQVATNLTAADAADQIGRIANIFFDQERLGMDYTQFLTSLGSAINVLGQNIAGTESEIVAATLRAAPAAAAIGMKVEDVLALSATLVESSASAERAGTQLNRALSETATNLEEFAEAFGMANDELKSLITENPAEAFFAIAESIAQIENPVDRVAAATELFGEVGAKAVNILGQSAINAAKTSNEYSRIAENIALSRKAFLDAVSLQLEFDRALDSVQNQLKILQNNFRVLAVTIGEALLPPLTKILTFAIPVVKVITELFDQAGDRAKLMAVGLLLLAAAIGPLLFALGSLLFSFGIITTGLTTFMLQVFNLIALPAKLAASLLWLINPMNLLIAGAAAASLALFAFQGDLQATIAYIQSMASQMYSWGYSMFSSFANGISAAAREVYNAVLSILNTIASFLRAFSPPKAGPLKNIDKWGRNLATTFASAFSEGDLSGVVKFAGLISTVLEGSLRSLSGKGIGIFSDISRLIGGAIGALAGATGVEDKGLAQTNTALEKLASLLLAVETGAAGVQELMNSLGNSLGQFGDDFKKLISLQFEYNKANEQLEAIRERLARFDQETNESIASIAENLELTAAGRAALIRATKINAAEEKKNLQAQEESAEQNLEAIEDQINAQEELINVLTDLLRAQEKLNDAVADDSGGDSGSGGGGADTDGIDGLPPLDIDSITSQLDAAGKAIEDWSSKASEDFATFATKVAEAEEIVRGFIAGLTGNLPTEAMGEGFWKGFLAGNDIRLKVLGFLKTITDYKDKLAGIGKAFADGFGVVKWAFVQGLKNDLVDINLLPERSTLVGWLAAVAVSAGLAFSGIYAFIAAIREAGESDLESPLQPILDQLREIDTAFLNGLSFQDKLEPKLRQLAGPLGSLATTLGVIAGFTFFNLDKLAEFLGKILLYAATGLLFLTGFAGVVSEIVNAAAGYGDVDRLAGSFVLMGDNAETAKQKAGLLLDALNKLFNPAKSLEGLSPTKKLTTFFGDLGVVEQGAALLGASIGTLVESVESLWNALSNEVTDNLTEVVTNLGTAWDNYGRSLVLGLLTLAVSITAFALSIGVGIVESAITGMSEFAAGLTGLLAINIPENPLGATEALQQVISGLWTVVTGITVQPFLQLAEGIVKVYSAVAGWDQKKTDDVIADIQQLRDEIDNAPNEQNWAQKFVDIILQWPGQKMDEATVATNGIAEAVANFGKKVIAFPGVAMTQMTTWISNGTTAISDFIAKIGANVASHWNKFVSTIQGFTELNTEALSNAFELFGDKLGGNVITGLSTAITLAAANVAQKIRELLPDADETIKTLFTGYGETLGNTLKDGFLSIFGGLEDEFRETIDSVFKAALSNLNEVAEFVNDPIGYIERSLTGSGSSNAVSLLDFAPILDEDTFASKFQKAGEDGVEGLNTGIENKKQSFIDATVELGKSGLDGILKFFRIQSPSGTMRDEVGAPMVDGIAVGFDRRASQLKKDFEDTASRIVAYIHGRISLDLLDTSKYDNILTSFALWLSSNTENLNSQASAVASTINSKISEALYNVGTFDNIRKSFQDWVGGLQDNDPMYNTAYDLGASIIRRLTDGVYDDNAGAGLAEAIRRVVARAMKIGVEAAISEHSGGSGGGSSGGNEGGSEGGDGGPPGGPNPSPVPFSLRLPSGSGPILFDGLTNDLGELMTNFAPQPQLVVNYYGDVDRGEGDKIARTLSEQMARDHRLRGWARR